MAKKKNEDFQLTSKEELQLQVQKELKKFIREEKKNKQSSNKESSAKEDNTELDLIEILAKEELKLKEQVKLVSKMTDIEKAEWLCDKHNEYILTMNYTLCADVLNGTEYYERFLLVAYLQELLNLLATYDIEITKEMTNVLIEKGEVELLSILNVLNFL